MRMKWYQILLAHFSKCLQIMDYLLCSLQVVSGIESNDDTYLLNKSISS